MPEIHEYVQEGLSPYKVIDEAAHVYEKELIYADNFVVKAEGASYEDFCVGKPEAQIKLEVTPEAIKGWASTCNLMLERGVQINLPQGHTKKADKNHGKVLKFRVGKHPKDPTKDALFGIVQFKDEKSAELAKTANVSIYAEPDFADGFGNKYKWPITHVALTDYPSIPALEPFRAIAASMFDEQPESTKVVPMPESVKPNPVTALKDKTIDQLLAEYGVEVPKDATEEQKKELLANYFKQVNEKFGVAVTPTAEPPKTPPVEPPKAPEQTSSIPKVQLSMISDARKTKIESLAEKLKITPVQQKMLEEKYCTPQKIALALSTEEGDDFDEQIKLLALNEPANKGKSGQQTKVALSNDMGDPPKKSSLVDNAKKRAEDAKKRTGL